MPRSEDSPKIRRGVKIRLGAEIGASAKYEVKKTVVERIPEDVTRANNNAWLTVVSPFTQWAGLIGDRLTYKRQLLRTQQEETLNAILSRAAPRLALLKHPVNPIPLKFLVPFLESASLEEPTSILVELWANLLVSSAERYHDDNVYYVGLISRMSSMQARLFQNMIGSGGSENVHKYMDEQFFHGNQFLRDVIIEAFRKGTRSPRSLVQAWNKVVDHLAIPGLVIEHIDIGHIEREDYDNGKPIYSIYDDKQENDYAILRGLGLLEYADTGYFDAPGKWRIKVMAHHISPLGLEFAKACGVCVDDPPEHTNGQPGKPR